MNKKITLKVGDNITFVSDYSNSPQFNVTKFNLDRVYRGLAPIQLSDEEYWFVNGEKYLSENILLPNDFEKITLENIHSVLEHNNINKEDYNFSDTDNVLHIFNDNFQVATLYLDYDPNWLSSVEHYLGKLQPLPLAIK
ncbi:MAG: hypothetical protein E6R13_05665 [Spirochaetes bacterium]|nr:MAG: hypothetical protein E6R13_05665 [Spirochaetota bacterium]